MCHQYEYSLLASWVQSKQMTYKHYLVIVLTKKCLVIGPWRSQVLNWC